MSGLRRLLAGAALLLAVAGAQAGLDPCRATPAPDLAAQDRLLRLAALAQQQLEDSPHQLALVARAGLDLARWGQPTSHTGIALRAHPAGAWAVRQLYYDCTERRPRLFDQGLAGFVFDTHDAQQGRIVLVLLPREAEALLAPRALDDAHALGLLGARYSANAHAFATRYQNCNQWVAELLALAWSGTPGASREQAQQALRESAYAPSVIEPGSPLLTRLAALSPWLHNDDHPPADLARGRWQVSMPVALADYARRRWPEATRIELCMAGPRVVVRHGWTPIASGCQAEPGDAVVALDAPLAPARLPPPDRSSAGVSPVTPDSLPGSSHESPPRLQPNDRA